MEMSIETKKRMKVSFVVTLIATILMAATVFLPFASANDDYRERLQKYGDEYYVEEIGMTNEDATDISLVEFIRMYAEAANQGMQKDICIACIVIISIFTGFALLSIVFAGFKKPIAVIIFDILAILAFRITQWDFEDRGVIPSSSYEWGCVSYLAYILGVLVLAGAVWMIIDKKKMKKIAMNQNVTSQKQED